MSNLVSFLGTKLINLMGIPSIDDTDYLIVQKNTNGDQKTYKILWSTVVALIGSTLSARVDYGALSNAEILAIVTPAELGVAFSTDDFINYTYYSGTWYTTGGGVLS